MSFCYLFLQIYRRTKKKVLEAFDEKSLSSDLWLLIADFPQEKEAGISNEEAQIDLITF